MTNHLERLRRNSSGQSLVEFGLSSILFFSLILGVIQFGRAVFQYNTVSNLAQEGARWASVRGSTSTTPATAAQLQTYIESRAPGFTVTVTATPANPSAVAPGATVSVRVVSSFSPVTTLLPAGTLNLESTAKMIVTR